MIRGLLPNVNARINSADRWLAQNRNKARRSIRYGYLFFGSSEIQAVSPLPKNNKDLRRILYLKNFFIDDKWLFFNFERRIVFLFTLHHSQVLIPSSLFTLHVSLFTCCVSHRYKLIILTEPFNLSVRRAEIYITLKISLEAKRKPGVVGIN